MAYKRAVRPGFTLYHEDVEMLLHLPTNQFKAFIMALLSYSHELAHGNQPVTPELTGWGSYIWPAIVRKIERDHQEYVNKCDRQQNRRLTVVDRGQPRSLTETETGTVTETVTETVAVAESSQGREDTPIEKAADAEEERGRRSAAPRGFTPPTAEEINAFCQDEGYTIDAQRFIDFYASKGWMVGANPMADWRSSVRLWHARDLRRRPEQGMTHISQALPPLARMSQEMDRFSGMIKPRPRDPEHEKAVAQANAIAEEWRNPPRPDKPMPPEEKRRKLMQVRQMLLDAGMPADNMDIEAIIAAEGEQEDCD